ncbi:MAG: AmmeMemoRadiSam system protein A [Limnochordia bacterium]|jgi:AmmeMemoRadiSam system protein A
MDVICGCLCPHPPLLLPEIGGVQVREVAATKAAMEEVARLMAKLEPETIVIISPHAPLLPRGIGVYTDPVLRGDFRQFDQQELAFSWDNDGELAQELLASPYYEPLGGNLDYGILVPLAYMLPVNFRVVALGIGRGSYQELYEAGGVIRRAAQRLGRKVLVIASGDLSHRLTPTAPAGYDPLGQVFDEQLLNALCKGDRQGILHMDPHLVDRAGQCALRPVSIMLGALGEQEYRGQLLSYEGPFGVGYGVVTLVVESPPVQLARRSIETYITTERFLEPPGDFPLTGKAGAFVTIYKDGKLRGCMGTTGPTEDHVAQEICVNAVRAATQDPRFPPVVKSELPHLEISVDVLGEPQQVGPEELDPQIYGIIVRQGPKAGLLLPAIPGIDRVEDQIAIAKQKGGIRGDDFILERFSVHRYF